MLDAVREADGDPDEMELLADDLDDGFEDDSSASALGARVTDVAAVALIGAAVGAGLGWLAWQATRSGAGVLAELEPPARRRPTARRGARALREAARAASASGWATRLAGLVGEAASATSPEDLGALVRRTVRRELQALARAAERRR